MVVQVPDFPSCLAAFMSTQGAAAGLGHATLAGSIRIGHSSVSARAPPLDPSMCVVLVETKLGEGFAR